MSEPVVALFCGSRDKFDEGEILLAIHSLPDGSVVIHGDAKGVDRLAGEFATARGLHEVKVPALWSRYDKAAGPLRNQAMLRLCPSIVHAFPAGGPGTKDMIAQAEKAGIEVVVHPYEKPHE